MTVGATSLHYWDSSQRWRAWAGASPSSWTFFSLCVRCLASSSRSPPPLPSPAPPVSRLTALTVFPLHYGRKKKQYLVWYHVLVWGISSLSCVPAIATNQIGMSTDGTCWFLGDYVWCFWAVWYMFVGFSIPGIIALYLRLRQFNATTDSVTDPAPLLAPPSLTDRPQISMSYVRVVTQSVLITFTFFLCWFWNMLFRMIIANHSPFPPWLVPLQVDPHRVSLSSPLSPADLLAWCSRLQQLHHLAALHPPGDQTGPPLSLPPPSRTAGSREVEARHAVDAQPLASRQR
jgi:hypothetical protein